MSVEDLSETPERKPWRAQPVPSGLVRFERKKSACAMCMLRDSHKVFGEHPEPGVQHSRIVVLSEAPGADEDLQGRPLIGQSGSFFTQCLSHAGIRRDRVWITNVLLCRPPRNDIESVEGSSGKGACVYGLREELDEAWKQGYRVILAQGNTALKELGFEGMNISKYRGSILGGKDSPLTKQGFKPFWVIPTFHPAFLVRNTWKRADGGTIDNTHAYITDLEKARKVSEPGWAPRPEKFLINPSFHEVYKFLEDLIREKHVVFLDIETDGLNPFYAKPVCIGLGRGGGETLVLQQREHSRNGFYWPERDWALLKPLVDEVLHDCPLVLQNAMFDIPFLYWNGFRVNPWALKYDTAVLHSLVASDSQHNLGVITSMFGTTPYWKESFQGREGSIYAMDKTDLYTYNARDCDVLDQVSKPMLELIAKQDLSKELELQQSLMPVLISMKIRGVGFENARKEEFRAKFEKYQSELEDSLREIASLPGEFSLSSRVHLRYFLYGYLDPGLAQKDLEFTERISEIEALKADLAAKEAAIETMPGTPAKKRKLLETLRNKITRSSGTKVLKELEAIHNVVHSTEPLAVLSTWKPLTTDSGELSTADDALQAYKHQLTKRAFELERRVEDHAEALKALSEAGKAEAKISGRYSALQSKADEELRKIGTLLEWLDKFGEWAEVQKLVSSFTKYTAAPDGRIHPNWNAFGTATGRLSCSEPNLQQLPKKGTGKDIRKFFIPREGYSFVSADLENAEVGIMGCETLDPLVLGAYYEGRNIHDDNTRTLFGIEKGDKLWDAARGAAKIFQFGRYQYGGSIAQIYKQVLMKCRDLNVTLQELTDADERWWEAHPKVKEWSDAIEAEVREKRVIRCESGRIRTFMHNDRDIGKEAKNFRIQGFVGWLANRALVRIERECFEAGLLSREEPEKFIVAPVLQVHDQLVLEARDDFVPWAKEHLSGAMTAPFMYKGVERFLRSDLSVGPSFGDLE